MEDPVVKLRSSLKELMDKKDAIEAEVEGISARLHSGPNPPGVKGNLVDKEGFPRADLDIAAVRTDRQRLICLTNDHKGIMKQIDQGLAQLHELTRGQTGWHAPPTLAPKPQQGYHVIDDMVAVAVPSRPRVVQPAPQQQQQQHDGAMDVDDTAGLVPFAEVDEVADGGPAAAAGVQVGDLMCSFGGVKLDTGSNDGQQLLPRVAQVLSSSEGKPVRTILLREGACVVLDLTPQKWSGRGLLGCHLKPL